jgi:hypothetical protein
MDNFEKSNYDMLGTIYHQFYGQGHDGVEGNGLSRAKF